MKPPATVSPEKSQQTRLHAASPSPTKRIAITGGIGSGKSYVCGKLRERGIIVYDCDSEAKRIMLSSDSVKRALTELIGNDAYIDGQINKPKVREFLLAKESNKQALNSIVHPAVMMDFMESGARWMECAILFESDFNCLVDYIVAVVASQETRISRIMQRDGITESKALEWISQQWQQEEVAKRADFVINNDNDDDLDKQINDLIDSLKGID